MPKLWCGTIKNNVWISESKWEIVKEVFLRLWRGLAPRHEDPCRMVKSHFGKTRHFSHAIHPLTKPLIFSKCLSKPLGFAQENVGRFQVAMDDSMLVKVCQSLWDLASQVGRDVFDWNFQGQLRLTLMKIDLIFASTSWKENTAFCIMFAIFCCDFWSLICTCLRMDRSSDSSKAFCLKIAEPWDQWHHHHA